MFNILFTSVSYYFIHYLLLCSMCINYCKAAPANYKSRSSIQINDDLLHRRRSSSRRKFVVFDEVKVFWFMNVISIRRESRPDGSVTSQGLDVPVVLQDWQLQRVILYVVIVIVDTTMIGRTCICSVTQQGRSQGSRSHTDACLRGCICEGPIGAALCINHRLPLSYLTRRMKNYK